MPRALGIMAVAGQRELLVAQQGPTDTVLSTIMFIVVQGKQAMGRKVRAGSKLEESHNVQLAEIFGSGVGVVVQRKHPV